MSEAYIVGHITVKNPEQWDRYLSQAPGTLAPWGAQIVFRGKRAEVLAGDNPHQDIVVIRFPDLAALNGWHASAAYQALVPLRKEAADVDLLAYAT